MNKTENKKRKTEEKEKNPRVDEDYENDMPKEMNYAEDSDNEASK